MITDKEKQEWFLHGFRASTKAMNGETADHSCLAVINLVDEYRFLNQPLKAAFRAQLDAQAAFPLDKTAKSLLDVTDKSDAQAAFDVKEKRLAELRSKELNDE